MSKMADIVLDIRKFLTGLAGSITWDLLFYIALGFTLLMIVFFIIKSSFSYEMRMERVLYKLNKWLNTNQFIDQNNLIEFNNLMKRTPKLLRYHWHQYMLYRENDPSFYMSPYNIIEKPIKTSSFTSSIKNLSTINISIGILSFLIGLAFISASSLSTYDFAQCLIIPVLVYIVNALAVMFLRARQDRNLSKFYLYFHYFDRKMDKAVTTMPEYVDFEVLFTRKEIKNGIPVLNEYLEKRARQEQEELEKARLNAVEHEVFDFSSAGIDGSLVLDRAMKETETYLNFRQRTMGNIEQLESETDSLKRNYENTQKDYQRKLQASKENVSRLRKQQEESTNRIESNYIKKQQQDEVKKQEQLEKDFDDATVRFNNEVQSLQAEIIKLKAELEEKRKGVEDAMNAEYQTFSKKLYDQIDQTVEDRAIKEKQEITDMKDAISDELQQANFTIEAQKKEIEELKKVIENANIAPGEYQYYNEALREEAQKVKHGKKNDKEVQTEATPVEAPVQKTPVEPAPVEAPVEQAPEVKEKAVQPAEETPAEPVYDEYGGYYDAEGYYRYANGTYYDPQGNYHDEFGGYYDPQGNYFPPETQVAPAEAPAEEATAEEAPVEETPAQEAPAPVEEEPKLEAPAEEAESATVEEEPALAEEAPVQEEQVQEEPAQAEITKDVAAEEAVSDEAKENAEADEAPVAEEAPKRRGRPRKEKEEAEEAAPKRRGRPRKEKPEEEEKPKKGPGRPKKETAEEEEPKKRVGRPRKEDVEPAAEQPKKRVGRPKKEEAEQVEQKKRVGRPKKEAEAEEEPKKRVGRPKKVESEVEEAPAKKTRGRPKKETSETEEQPVKKGRGRPKKEVSETQAPAPAKKRGRPRKTQDSLDEIKKLNEQILEENRKLQQQQAELNSQLGQTLSQLDLKSNDEN